MLDALRELQKIAQPATHTALDGYFIARGWNRLQGDGVKNLVPMTIVGELELLAQFTAGTRE